MNKAPLPLWQRIALGLSIPAAAAMILIYMSGPMGLQCPFFALTGLYCPGCGATRALSALLHGDVKASLHNNLLLFPLLALIAVLIVKPGITLKRSVMAAILAVILGFTVLRNIPVAPFTYLAPVPLHKTVRNGSEEPRAHGGDQPDQDQRGGQQEDPEPADRQGAPAGTVE